MAVQVHDGTKILLKESSYGFTEEEKFSNYRIRFLLCHIL